MELLKKDYTPYIIKKLVPIIGKSINYKWEEKEVNVWFETSFYYYSYV